METLGFILGLAWIGTIAYHAVIALTHDFAVWNDRREFLAEQRRRRLYGRE